jgi:hypothetical protein
MTDTIPLSTELYHIYSLLQLYIYIHSDRISSCSTTTLSYVSIQPGGGFVAVFITIEISLADASRSQEQQTNKHSRGYAGLCSFSFFSCLLFKLRL